MRTSTTLHIGCYWCDLDEQAKATLVESLCLWLETSPENSNDRGYCQIYLSRLPHYKQARYSDSSATGNFHSLIGFTDPDSQNRFAYSSWYCFHLDFFAMSVGHIFHFDYLKLNFSDLQKKDSYAATTNSCSTSTTATSCFTVAPKMFLCPYG